MCCRTSLVCTAVLHPYAMLVCRQHRRPLSVRVAEPRRYAPLSYIRMHCSSAVNIADLYSYALQNLIGMHRCPTFVRAARLLSTSLTSVRTSCRISLVCTAVYICTCCFSGVDIANLCSYALQNLAGIHRCPTFVRAARLPSTSPTSVGTRCRTSLVCTAVLHSYALLVCRQHRQPPFVRVAESRCYAPLSYIRTRCSSAVNIADLRSYALQNLVGMHRCPTSVRAARLPSTSLTSVRMRCRTSLVCTAVLPSYALLVCRIHR